MNEKLKQAFKLLCEQYVKDLNRYENKEIAKDYFYNPKYECGFKIDGKNVYFADILKAFDSMEELIKGKVVARFWCDKVELIEYCGMCYMAGDIANTNQVAKQSCLDFADMKRYLGNKNGYAIHISKLELFDKPRRINDFIKYDKNTLHIDNCIIGFGFGSCERLSNAPQSWCYIEGE